LLEDFAKPLLGEQSLAGGPVMVTFSDDGVMYPVTLEQTAAGLRIVVRRAAPLKKPEKQAEKQPEKKDGYRQELQEPHGPQGPHGQRPERQPAHPSPVSAIDSGESPRSRLAELLAAPVALAHERGA